MPVDFHQAYLDTKTFCGQRLDIASHRKVQLLTIVKVYKKFHLDNLKNKTLMIKEYVFSLQGVYQGMQQHTFEMNNKEIVYKNLSPSQEYEQPLGILKRTYQSFSLHFMCKNDSYSLVIQQYNQNHTSWLWKITGPLKEQSIEHSMGDQGYIYESLELFLKDT